MNRTVLVFGAQWGDEGKGKVVDLLAGNADAVVRWQGGHNAGHTLVIGNRKLILHLLPAGVVHASALCLIGHGVVLSTTALLDEISSLEEYGISVRDRLHISPACPLLLPCHQALDQAREEEAGDRRIGTTGRGIGPAYEDRAARRGLRVGDLYSPDVFYDRLAALLDYHNFVLTRYHGKSALDVARIGDQALRDGERIRGMVTDIPALLWKLQARGARVLFEGAQGFLLDVDMGTYPFVTASNTVAGSVCVGSGVGPGYVDYILGVAKAYTTRVGAGPFPTEISGDAGRILAERGHEFGATTGRPRRCGWLDAVALRRAVQINCIQGICLTKLDVLDTMETIQVCTSYGVQGGERLDGGDMNVGITPVYVELPGWRQGTDGIRSSSQLPEAARAYIKYIEDAVGVPVVMVSTSPERWDTIFLDETLTVWDAGAEAVD